MIPIYPFPSQTELVSECDPIPYKLGIECCINKLRHYHKKELICCDYHRSMLYLISNSNVTFCLPSGAIFFFMYFVWGDIVFGDTAKSVQLYSSHWTFHAFYHPAARWWPKEMCQYSQSMKHYGQSILRLNDFLIE